MCVIVDSLNKHGLTAVLYTHAYMSERSVESIYSDVHKSKIILSTTCISKVLSKFPDENVTEKDEDDGG